MLNAEYQSVVHTDHKSLMKFLNAEYHEDIFACWANILCLLNICIPYIPSNKNIIANRLSQVIFNNPDYSPYWLVNKLAKEVFELLAAFILAWLFFICKLAIGHSI